jgi:hypothetical protein
VDITIPAGWQPDGTVVFPSPGPLESAVGGPTGAALVIGWTSPVAGLYDDPCQQIAHLEPDIKPGPTVKDFVAAVVAHPLLAISDPVDVGLGGYRATYFELTAPSDISNCRDWRPFEPGIYAQGPDNRWRIWVVDVDGFRMIVLAEDFPATPPAIKAELSSMVESIGFVP